MKKRSERPLSRKREDTSERRNHGNEDRPPETNPRHKEDFNALLRAAVQKREQELGHDLPIRSASRLHAIEFSRHPGSSFCSEDCPQAA
jgi:hypothetical protein